MELFEKYVGYYNVVILGYKSTGKSSFVQRISNDKFDNVYRKSPLFVQSKNEVMLKDRSVGIRFMEMTLEDSLNERILNALLLQNQQATGGNITSINRQTTQKNLELAELLNPQTRESQIKSTVEIDDSSKSSNKLKQDNHIMLFFDLTSRESFEAIISVLKYLDSKNLSVTDLNNGKRLSNVSSIMLVGNKFDEDQKREIKQTEVSLLTDQYNLKYMEISVKLKYKVTDILMSLLPQNDKSLVYKEIQIPEFYSKNSIRKNFDYIYKYMMLGDSTVGKSSFFKRFFKNEFQLEMLPTIGIADDWKKVQVYSSSTLKVQIWDTAGQDNLRSITKNYYQNADGIILLFDVSKKNTYKNITNWVEDIIKYGNSCVKVYLVGNKIDLLENPNDKHVSFEEIGDFARKIDVPYYEISCRYNLNIDKIIEDITVDIWKSNKKVEQKSFQITERRNKEDSKNKKRCC